MKKVIVISLLLLLAFSFSFGQTILKTQSPQVKIENNQLNVAWQVREEAEIDYYDILLSKDGTNFKSIGIVKSRGLEGNSTGLLDYTFNIDFGAAAKTLGYIGFIGVLSFGFSRKRIWLMLLSAIVLFIIISCKRDKDNIVDENKTYFLQIKQVAKNNTVLYSNVITIKSQ
ncbi:MAG: hypothetical protein QM594_03560 [Niabella sp.]